jgi:hypothetical protein
MMPPGWPETTTATMANAATTAATPAQVRQVFVGSGDGTSSSGADGVLGNEGLLGTESSGCGIVAVATRAARATGAARTTGARTTGAARTTRAAGGGGESSFNGSAGSAK